MLYKGGQRAGKGTYWNMATGERLDAEQEITLPGEKKTLYLKAHGIVALLAGPVLGLVFAVFLPFIGIAMTIGLAVKKVATGLSSAAASSLSFGWRPIEAYLSGRKKKKAMREKKTGKQK